MFISTSLLFPFKIYLKVLFLEQYIIIEMHAEREALSCYKVIFIWLVRVTIYSRKHRLYFHFWTNICGQG
jgi:hypothetical protein